MSGLGWASLRAVAVVSVAVVAVGVGIAVTSRTPDPALREGQLPSRPQAPPPPTSTSPTDTAQGLQCIRGGTSREEVRRVMGEPDSIVFGDWVYGGSSVTFGYGVVLDYSNAGGNLIVCP